MEITEEDNTLSIDHPTANKGSNEEKTNKYALLCAIVASTTAIIFGYGNQFSSLPLSFMALISPHI